MNDHVYTELAKKMLDMIGRKNFAQMAFTFALSEAAKNEDANVLHNALCRIVEVNKQYLSVDFEIETDALTVALPGQFSDGIWETINLLSINEIYECLKDRNGDLVANVKLEVWKYSPRTIVKEWRHFFANAKAERYEGISSLIGPNKRLEVLARVVAMIPPEFDLSQVEYVARSA